MASLSAPSLKGVLQGMERASVEEERDKYALKENISLASQMENICLAM